MSVAWTATGVSLHLCRTDIRVRVQGLTCPWQGMGVDAKTRNTDFGEIGSRSVVRMNSGIDPDRQNYRHQSSSRRPGKKLSAIPRNLDLIFGESELSSDMLRNRSATRSFGKRDKILMTTFK